MSIYNRRTGQLMYTYEIKEDDTGGKPKWWAVRTEHYENDTPFLPQVQRISRHDTPSEAAQALLELQRQDMER
jgi:hypothetical protein